MAEVANVVTVQAYGTDGLPKTVGGDIFTLKVEQLCNPQTTFICDLDAAQDSVAGLPIEKSMTDNSDGTYSASYTISASAGTISVGVVHSKTSAIESKYYDNFNFSEPYSTIIMQTNLNRSFDSDPFPSPLDQDQNSAIYTGTITPTSSSSWWRFEAYADDYVSFKVYQSTDTSRSGSPFVDFEAYYPSTQTSNYKTLVAGEEYPFTCTFKEGGGGAKLKVRWCDGYGCSRSQIPDSAFYQYRRVEGTVKTVEIAPTSVPAQCTIESGAVSHTAHDSTSYLVDIQSRNSAGTAHTVTDDVYIVTFTDSSGTVVATETATHQTNGLYQASAILTAAGTFTVSVQMTNAYTATDSSIPTSVDSSYTLVVNPSEIDPAQCFTDLPSPIPAQSLNTDKFFNLQIVDKWGNYYTGAFPSIISGGTSDATSTVYYVNNDLYKSKIGVGDWPNWSTTYFPIAQSTIAASSITDNYDGTLNVKIPGILWAGYYRVEVEVNNDHVLNSPFSYSVKADPLLATNSVVADYPDVLYTGFSYKFQIQGRDAYHNNVLDTLSGLGVPASAVLTSVDNGSIQISATVTDNADFNGVYDVNIDVPSGQTEGDYSVLVTLNGATLSTAQNVEVKACSNFYAVDMGLIEDVGATITYDEIFYDVDEKAVVVELQHVNIYCNGTPEQVLLWAKSTHYDGFTVKDLDEEELAEEGITIGIAEDGVTPILTVYSEDFSRRNFTYDVVIRATTVEDPLWYNTQILKINFEPEEPLPPPFDITTLQISEDAPVFVKGSWQALKLKESVDEDVDVLQFAPITLSCRLESWHRTLPPIEGEDEDQNLKVKVSAGDADQFLAYSPATRKFRLIPREQQIDPAPERATAVVYIVLSNGLGYSRLYELDVTYLCPKEEPEEQKIDTLTQPRYDEDPPVPTIHSVTSYGKVTVRFNKKMQPKEVLTDNDLLYSPARRLFEDTNDDSIVVGQPRPDFKNYTMLHNGTLAINGTIYPSVEVAVKPDDSQDLCAKDLDFKWETLAFSSEEWVFQLYFDVPACVSSSTQVGDTLVITFFDQRLFKDVDGKVIWPEFVLETKIIRQLFPEEERFSDLGTVIGSLLIACACILVVMQIFIGSSCSRFLHILKHLQLMIVMCLIQLYLGAHVTTFLRQLLKVMLFEIFDPRDFLEEGFNLNPGEPIDITFKAIGYESANVIQNIGLTFIFLLIAPGIVLILIALAKQNRFEKVKSYAQRGLQYLHFNLTIMVADVLFLIFTVASIIQFYQAKQGKVSYDASFGFACFLVAVSLGFVLTLTLYLLLFKFDQIKIDREEIRKLVGVAYERLNVKRGKRATLVFILLSYLRRFVICLVITYGRESPLAQRLFVSFSTLFMACYISVVSPFSLPSVNRLEIANEFAILLMYGHFLTQTDYVSDVEGRYTMGWSLITLISLSVLLNIGFYLGEDLTKIYYKLKYRWIRNKKIQEVKDRLRRKFEEIQAKKTELKVSQYSLKNYYGKDQPWVSNRGKKQTTEADTVLDTHTPWFTNRQKSAKVDVIQSGGQSDQLHQKPSSAQQPQDQHWMANRKLINDNSTENQDKEQEGSQVGSVVSVEEDRVISIADEENLVDVAQLVPVKTKGYSIVGGGSVLNFVGSAFDKIPLKVKSHHVNTQKTTAANSPRQAPQKPPPSATASAAKLSDYPDDYKESEPVVALSQKVSLQSAVDDDSAGITPEEEYQQAQSKPQYPKVGDDFFSQFVKKNTIHSGRT